jgi:hypothetical protein
MTTLSLAKVMRLPYRCTMLFYRAQHWALFAVFTTVLLETHVFRDVTFNRHSDRLTKMKIFIKEDTIKFRSSVSNIPQYSEYLTKGNQTHFPYCKIRHNLSSAWNQYFIGRSQFSCMWRCVIGKAVPRRFKWS